VLPLAPLIQVAEQYAVRRRLRVQRQLPAGPDNAEILS
jgi:hypothetical protein